MPPETEFGYIYDWMEGYEYTDPYASIESQDDLLWKTYGEMTAGLDDPMPYDQWKELYGHYINVYNPNQERLLQESFDIKVSQTEDLFTLKTEQEERDFGLIEKYSAIDDSDDFESTTEMAIRHSKETEDIEQKLNRYKRISSGKALEHKKKEIQNKTLLNSMKSGQAESVVKELDEAFWDEMKVVRSQYDKERLEKNQALDKLILKSEQTVISAFRAKEDSIKTALVSAQGRMKNDAVSLLANKLASQEEYNEELWDTLGTLAAEEAFESYCADVVCTGGLVCNEMTGECGTPQEACEDSGGIWVPASGLCMTQGDV